MSDNTKQSRGGYLGRVSGQRLGATQPKDGSEGTPYVEITFRVIKKLTVSSNSYEELENPFTAYVSMYLTPATFEKFNVEEKLREAGFTGNDLSTLSDASSSFQDLSGNEVPLWFGGKDKYDWQISIKKEQASRPSDPAVAVQVAELFNGMLKGGSGSSTTTSATQTTQKAKQAKKPAPLSDEDIPF